MSIIKTDKGYKIIEQYKIDNKEYMKFKEAPTECPLFVEIKAIHAGATRNNINYTETALVTGIPTWTTPDKKPVIKDHCMVSDNVIGRVYHAEFVANVAKPYTRLIAKISDPDACQKILDERYINVSIGSEIYEAKCNICDTDVVQFGPCEHYRGVKYDDDGNEITDNSGIKCEWVVNSLAHEEISIVGTSADREAKISGIINIYKTNNKELGGESMPTNIKNALATESVPETKAVDNTAETKKTEAVIPDIATDAAEDTKETTSTKDVKSATEETTDGAKEEPKQDEKQTEASMPDTAFALVKTVDTQKVRELLYKKEDGTIDESYLRDAISNINKVQNFSAQEKAKGLAKLKRVAKKEGIELSGENRIEPTNSKLITEQQERISILEEENELLKLEVEELSFLVTSLENSMSITSEEHNAVIKSLADAKEELHTARVEHLVDIKYITNRETTRSRDNVINEYTTKSDAILVEFINEFKKGIALEEPPRIPNETLPMNMGTENDKVDESVDIKQLPFIDRNTVLKAIDGDEKAIADIALWKSL